MAEGRISKKLLFELLESIQDRLDRIEAELQIMRQHVAALVQSDLRRGDQVYALETRVARIERRLDLTDATD
ncbi:MAG: hypothetical protein JKP97_03320 [Rhodobacteraceae bacterium]|jgi:transcription elongation GreA/GreB family factor|nr:hypothetical protein [Paracoccaceae bacterium]